MATSKTKSRLSTSIPKELLDELRAQVPPRQRPDFIAQALARELHRLRLLEAIKTTAGAWRVEDHPELTRTEDVAQWVKEQRTQRHWPLLNDTPQDG